MTWIRVALLATVVFCVVGFEWFATDAQDATVRTEWAKHIPRVTLAQGVRGVVGPDTVWWGAYSQFTPAEMARLRAMFDKLGVAYGDSAARFVPAQTATE